MLYHICIFLFSTQEIFLGIYFEKEELWVKQKDFGLNIPYKAIDFTGASTLGKIWPVVFYSISSKGHDYL